MCKIIFSGISKKIMCELFKAIDVMHLYFTNFLHTHIKDNVHSQRVASCFYTIGNQA